MTAELILRRAVDGAWQEAAANVIWNETFSVNIFPSTALLFLNRARVRTLTTAKLNFD